MRSPLRYGLVLLLAVAPALGAQESAPLSYDVSTVKPHGGTDHGMRWWTHDSTLEITGVPLKMLIASGWDVREDQVWGQPAWVDEDRWDIVAKVTDADKETLSKLTQQDRARMLQALLVERFHIQAHMESRTAPIYELHIARGGLKMERVTPAAASSTEPAKVAQGGTWIRGRDGVTEMNANTVGMESLVRNVAANLHRTVLDKTGIPAEDRFNFKLQWAVDRGLGTSPQVDAPPMPEALEQQLGLHLESMRGPVPQVVVDHAERPTEN